MLEKTVAWLLIQSVRYALNRDNEIAMKNFETSFDDAIKDIKVKAYKTYVIEKIIDEIKSELIWTKKDEKLWLVFIEKLKELL